MASTHRNQSGFSAVEGLLITVIVLLVGFIGYYVWHANKQTEKLLSTSKTTPHVSVGVNSFTACEKAKGSVLQETFPEKCVTKDGKSFTQSVTNSPSATQYLLIKEWGVELPYSGGDTFSYHIDSGLSLATVISGNLSVQYQCTKMGAGQIQRFTAKDAIYPDGTAPTASQASASDPSSWGHVGSYYYHFVHDQSACPEISDYNAVGVQDGQNAANAIIKAGVSKLREVSP